MANEGNKSNDFYAVLGLNKECSDSELRNAYKKLALKWHPDRCSASGNVKFVEEAKKKFQAIQEAYSVLSDANKRLMYDVGVYDSDDDENGMGDFLNEMVTMMSQTKSNENGEESFEELQQLFDDMFQADIGLNGSTSLNASGCSTSSTFMTYSESSNSNKRNSTQMNYGKAEDSSSFGANYQNFCFGIWSFDHVCCGSCRGATIAKLLDQLDPTTVQSLHQCNHRKGSKRSVTCYGQSCKLSLPMIEDTNNGVCVEYLKVVKHLQEDVVKEKGGILEGGGSKRQRKGRKHKMSCGHDVSSNDNPGISAN